MIDDSLTIGIVSHGHSEMVHKLLQSLDEYKEDINFDVVVLENLKHEPLIDLPGVGFGITYLQNDEPLSLSANVNKIFQHVEDKAEYYCILNPDILFVEEVFSELMQVMQVNEIDVIAPLIVDSYGVIQDSFRRVPTPIELILRYLGLSKTVYKQDSLPDISFPDWIGAMFMLMRSSVFRSVGGFNTNYRLYFEDVDFGVRMKQAGYSIGVYKNKKVIHDAQRSSHRKIDYLLLHIQSAIKFFRSNEYKRFKVEGL